MPFPFLARGRIWRSIEVMRFLPLFLVAASAVAQDLPPPELTEYYTPVPPVVAAPAGAAPSDAIVLFDGTSLGAWEPARPDGQPWKIEDGAMVVIPTPAPLKPCDQQTKQAFGD